MVLGFFSFFFVRVIRRDTREVLHHGRRSALFSAPLGVTSGRARGGILWLRDRGRSVLSIGESARKD